MLKYLNKSGCLDVTIIAAITLSFKANPSFEYFCVFTH